MHITRSDAQNIVAEMKASIHRDVNIMDENGIILASTNPARTGQLHAGALQVLQQQLPVLVIHQDDIQRGVQRGINLPVMLHGQVEGVIGITGEPDEVAVFGEVIKRMTEILLEGLHQQEQTQQLRHAQALFVENWLFANEPDWQEMEIRGRLLGFDISASYTVALLEPSREDVNELTRREELQESRSDQLLRMVQQRIQAEKQHFCTVINNRVLLLLGGMERESVKSRIQQICADIESYCSLTLAAGVSSPSTGGEDLRRCYREARTATAAASSGADRILFYDQVSLELVLQSIPPVVKAGLRHLVFSGCDAQEEEEFRRTIRLYYKCGGSVKACARELFIHRNTFQYRMDALKKRTGYDLRIPRDALTLYLASQ